MSFESIDFEISSGCARLMLNRPETLNCINEEMHAELRAALEEAQSDGGCRALLLTGAGRGFCAGQDLGDRRRDPGAEPVDLGESLQTHYNPLIRRLRSLDMPVVCAVNGVAAGAGVSIALACDVVLGARSAQFVMSFSRMGLVPDAGGTWVLPRLLGHARASALLMLGDSVSSEQAERWGMIWRCVDDDQLEAEARALCRSLAARPTRGLALIRRALVETWSNSLDRQLDLECELQREAGRTQDYREAVAAFLEKRDPTFKGR